MVAPAAEGVCHLMRWRVREKRFDDGVEPADRAVRELQFFGHLRDDALYQLLFSIFVVLGDQLVTPRARVLRKNVL